MYKETYRELSHGTDEESAEKIKANGFEIRGRSDSWCGSGIYFMILRKGMVGCKQKMWGNKKGNWQKFKPAVLFADIIDIDDDKIFDLRAYKDLCDFEEGISQLFGEYSFELSGIEDVEKLLR